ncbi:MAG: DUF4097 domain-containing protein [Spirochaetaceae bacterium]|jgi:DUF4097 and DUF4098 domain-containing protein YvlB|nr:DUF4097 domain-containing protein [Spirochaetaceae bacterium]
MARTTANIRGTALALFLLLAGGGAGGHAGENSPGELPLVNTVTLSLTGVENLSLDYADDEVIIRESGTGELVIREYMERDRPRYHANVSRSGGNLSVRRGRRPWLSWSWKARIEIYIPPSFRENIRISHAGGALRAETGLLDYRTIDVSSGSGTVFFRGLSAETVSIRVSSGSLDVEDIGGSTFISISSGRLRIGALAGGEHRIKASSGRTRIGAIRGNSTIEVSSGSVAVETIEGNAAIEIQSGNIQIAGLTGTSHRLRSSSGRTTIERARGRMDAHVSSGSINIGNFSGEGGFEISSGAITLDARELTGDLRFTVSAGDITVTVPREFPFNLDAVTNSGKVLVNETGRETARVSGNSTVLRPFGSSPVRTIYARTSSGSVIINRGL